MWRTTEVIKAKWLLGYALYFIEFNLEEEAYRLRVGGLFPKLHPTYFSTLERLADLNSQWLDSFSGESSEAMDDEDDQQYTCLVLRADLSTPIDVINQVVWKGYEISEEHLQTVNEALKQDGQDIWESSGNLIITNKGYHVILPVVEEKLIG